MRRYRYRSVVRIFTNHNAALVLVLYSRFLAQKLHLRVYFARGQSYFSTRFFSRIPSSNLSETQKVKRQSVHKVSTYSTAKCILQINGLFLGVEKSHMVLTHQLSGILLFSEIKYAEYIIYLTLRDYVTTFCY